MDRSDATVLTYRSRGSARRLVFEPRDDGRHTLVEKALTKADTWRTVGTDVVDSIDVETPD